MSSNRMLDPSLRDQEDGSYSFGGATSSTNPSLGSGEGTEERAEPLATSTETKLVNGSKCLVYFALAIAAAAVSTVVFMFLSDEQESTMVVEFQAYSREILKQAQANSANMFEELWDLGKSITSHALDAEMQWPNVTVPHFDIRAQDNHSRVEFVGFAPFVTPETKAGWEAYSVANQGWIAQDYAYRGWNTSTPAPIPTEIHRYNGIVAEEVTYDGDMFNYWIPLWQLHPAVKDTSVINLDLASIPVFAHLLWDVKVKKVEQYSRILGPSILHLLLGTDVYQVDDHPRGTIYQPVFQDFYEGSEVGGMMIGSLTWDKMFENVLFESSAPLLVEIEGTCNAIFTYKVTGTQIEFLGYGQGLRDPAYDKYKESADLLDPLNSRPGYPPVKHTHRHTDASHGESHCTYVMNTYPTKEFTEVYKTSEPIWMTIVIASVFVFTALVFLLYDYLVQQRQSKLLTTARRTTAIVTSLFPKTAVKRMMEEAKQNEAKQDRKRTFKTKHRMSEYFHAEDNNNDVANGQIQQQPGGAPIADLFPSATIMFADIVGFTAWSSERSPVDVFTLLETLYGAFDAIAKRRRVFKVETVGDCYVAVCGLPEVRKDNHLIMARFAKDCLRKMKEQLIALETTLGPDTGTLGMRVGLHTGPVTAGVLRGERARFQLFGDTVNTTARIETTGRKNCVHLSEQTANLIIEAGKPHWVQRREDQVEVKGKGMLQTYWLTSSGDLDGASSHFTSDAGSSDGDSYADSVNELSRKDRRLVEWNVQMLSKFLKQIQAQRNATAKKSKRKSSANLKALAGEVDLGAAVVLDEVQEVINLPVNDGNNKQDYLEEAERLNLSQEVLFELTEYISGIAATYNAKNPFHNWDHSAHVTMSVCKLLRRIASAETSPPPGAQETCPSIDDRAYGIASDPLTQFTLILSAIAHDAGHMGVPNMQLIKEGSTLASTYRDKSVAEQHSVNITWNLLMEDRFANLRAAIYSNEEELRRFRQLLINSVLATDIMDKELGAARKARWEKAFSSEEQMLNNESQNVREMRKATIAIEHLIQASDVAHAMQHWHIFTKWNEKLFMEMYKAYQEGRAENDPSLSWYKGEIGFFDFYIIPLAKKLRQCGIFSDEYLNYAEQNRMEWEMKGQEQVEKYLENYNKAAAASSASDQDKWVREESSADLIAGFLTGGDAMRASQASTVDDWEDEPPSAAASLAAPLIANGKAAPDDIDVWV